MNFPISINVNIDGQNGSTVRNIVLRGGLTTLIGPNGGGKTHLLRGIKNALPPIINGKKVRFLSAGRIGLLEQYRSDYDGQRSGNPNYEEASFGYKRDLPRRHQVETLNGDFQTLSERTDILIKVQERLRKLFKRDLIIEWDAGLLKIVFARLDTTSKPYSSGREASGLLHLVGILAALYDDEVGALLIDEPEVSLHPQLQSFLLNEIYATSGQPTEIGYKKIIVMATHSTEMLRISKLEDLMSLVFCHELDTPPVQLDPNAGELKSKKLQALIARLGQEHKLSLFCRRPLLVEGPSDVLIASFLSNKLELHLEAAGSQLLPVIGKGQMPIVAKLMKILGKKPVVLVDADAFTDNMDLINSFLPGDESANAKAAKLGAPSAINLASATYNDFCQFVDTKWNSIFNKAETHPYWINRGDMKDIEAQRRATFCTLLNMEDSKISELEDSTQWIRIRDRLLTTLELLEIAGCFILRKGTIECYYQASDIYTSDGKPTAAVEEIDHLEHLDNSVLKEKFAEVIRCIEHASLSENINEAESLRDILLSIAAPAVARLDSFTTTQNLQVLAKTLLGSRANIFDCSVENQKLRIDIKSNILNVTGFPLIISKDDDVVKLMEKALRENT